MKLKHELWEDDAEGSADLTFCLAGPRGDGARQFLSPNAKLIWTVEADSHFEAMTAYYQFMGWATYRTDWEQDKRPYPDDWAN